MDLLISSDSNERESIVALISNDASYNCLTLDTLGAVWRTHCHLEILEAGTEFDYPPFKMEGDDRLSFKTDCIVEGMCNGNSFKAFYYEGGRFRHFQDGD